MAKVRIPQVLLTLTNGEEFVHVSGNNVRQIIDELDQLYPGVKAALLDNGKLKPDVAVMLDDRVGQLGLLEPVSEENELLFIPAISGG
jgi:molybdopterin synthase sulfur carrier subunit